MAKVVLKRSESYHDPLNLKDTKKNFLTALEPIRKDKRWHWKCLCDCGNMTVVRTTYFTSGKTISCGCKSSKLQLPRRNTKPEGESALNSLFNTYLSAAKRRKYPFLLTKGEFKALVSQNCYYCNSIPRPSCFNKKANGILLANGVDRVDNSSGYSMDNCVPCCKNCNIAKATMSQKDFFAWIRDLFSELTKNSKLDLLTDCGLDFSNVWDN